MNEDGAYWTIDEITNRLIETKDASRANVSHFLPQVLTLIRDNGNTYTREQVLRLVMRPGGYSNLGFIALCALYTDWPEHSRSLGLPLAFAETGARKVAWYAAIRERYPRETAKDIFGQALRNLPDGDLTYAGFDLVFTSDVIDWIDRKWMNRGDEVLLDCLTEIV